MRGREELAFIRDILIAVSLLALAARFILPYAAGVLLPFFIAYLVASALKRPVAMVSKMTRVPGGIVSAFFVVGTLGLLSAGVWLGVGRGIYELGRILSYLGENGDRLGESVDRIFGSIDSISTRIPMLRENGESLSRISAAIDEFVKKTASDLLGRLSSWVGEFVTRTLARLPETVLYILVTVVASVYISADFDRVRSGIAALIPDKYREGIMKIKGEIRMNLRRCVKAYSLIYLITFGELFLGLGLAGVRYSFILSILISFVDILPIFGVGTVLIPWSLIALALGEKRLFTSLLILYAVITFMRQAIEPKILGSSLGISPLFTLISMFAGYRLFGVFGMIFLPLLSLILFGTLSGKKKEEIHTENSDTY